MSKDDNKMSVSYLPPNTRIPGSVRRALRVDDDAEGVVVAYRCYRPSFMAYRTDEDHF